MNLTVHILVTKNVNLNDCIESIQPLGADIIVGDLTNQIENVDAKIVRLPPGDYSKARNELVEISKTDWQLYLEPWEKMVSGHEQLLWHLTQPYDSYKLYVVNNHLINKETRLWNKLSGRLFQRPIYESLEPEASETIDCVISGVSPNRFNETIEVLQEWKRKSPQNADVEYYLALTYLNEGNHEEFLKHAEYFLFRTNDVSPASVLMHYYVARILLKKNKHEECVSHITNCLIQQPTFAEFWCLLGDVFVKNKQINRAITFYENAILFGSRRLNNDSFPVDISKYKEYPMKMISLCSKI